MATSRINRAKFKLIQNNGNVIVKFTPEFDGKSTHPYLSTERLAYWGFNAPMCAFIDIHLLFKRYGEVVSDIKAVQFQHTGKADLGMITPGLPTDHRVIKAIPMLSEYDEIDIVAVNPNTAQFRVVQTIKRPLR